MASEWVGQMPKHMVRSIVMTAPSTLPTPLGSFIVENKKPQTQSRLQALLPPALSLLTSCIGGCMYRAFAPTQNQHKL
jgi:hypothetical protein